MRRTIIYTIGLGLILMTGLQGCSDNSTGVEEPPKPEIPAISEMEPETGTFDDNYPAGEAAFTSATYNHFNAAGEMVNTGKTILSLKDFFDAFIETARANDPEFKDGMWVWDFSHSAQGISIDIQFTGDVNEDAGEVTWKMFISTSGGTVNFDDYKFMEGVTAIDGSTGNWKMYPFDPSVDSPDAVLEFNWTINSDTDRVFTINVHHTDSADYTIKFSEDGTTRELTIKSSDGEVDALVHWDSETGAGYINQSGTKLCWNENYEDVSCS